LQAKSPEMGLIQGFLTNGGGFTASLQVFTLAREGEEQRFKTFEQARAALRISCISYFSSQGIAACCCSERDLAVWLQYYLKVVHRG